MNEIFIASFDLFYKIDFHHHDNRICHDMFSIIGKSGDEMLWRMLTGEVDFSQFDGY